MNGQSSTSNRNDENIETANKRLFVWIQRLLSLHTSLLNYIALLSTGGLALLLAENSKISLVNDKYIVLFYALSILGIFFVKFLLFYQAGMKYKMLKNNLTELENEKISYSEYKDNIAKASDGIEMFIDILGIIALFLFFLGSVLWIFNLFNIHSGFMAFIFSVLLIILPLVLLYLYKKEK